jgi:hypothetical protein
MADSPKFHTGNVVEYVGPYIPQPSPEGDVGGLETGTRGIVVKHQFISEMQLRRIGYSSKDPHYIYKVVFPGWLCSFRLKDYDLAKVSRDVFIVPRCTGPDDAYATLAGLAQIANHVDSVYKDY